MCNQVRTFFNITFLFILATIIGKSLYSENKIHDKIQDKLKMPAMVSEINAVTRNNNPTNLTVKKYDGKNTAILCFHDINGFGKYSIKDSEFKEILNQLNQNFEVYSLKNWYEKVFRGEYFEKPPVVITFDDGYISIFTYVIPLLQRYKFGATFFIYLKKYEDQPLLLKKMGDLPEEFEIGSHSLSHANMEKLFILNKNQFYREIFLSKKKLEYLIGKPVISWAWPYGYYNEEIELMAMKAGYSLQVNTDPKNTEDGWENGSFNRYTIQNPNPVDQVKEILSRIPLD